MKVKIYCAHTKIMHYRDLEGKKNPRNPNRHPSGQIDAILKVIIANGWRLPVVISNRSGLMTKGHGRLDAAALGDIENVPVDYQDYSTEAEEIADMLADNKLSSMAVLDEQLTRDILDNLISEVPNFDILSTGFDMSFVHAAPPNMFDFSSESDGELESNGGTEKEKTNRNLDEVRVFVLPILRKKLFENLNRFLTENGTGSIRWQKK
jgi:hypothetical protein